MHLRFKKTRDGCVLTCIRDDGSLDVQRSSQGAFFAIHDLLHYAVETTLGFDQAFFGLLACGWDFRTFEDHDDPRYQSIPAQAIQAEILISILARHFSGGAWEDPELQSLWAEEINNELAVELAKVDHPPLAVPADDLVRICRQYAQLGTRWANVPIGEHLELEFPARVSNAAPA